MLVELSNPVQSKIHDILNHHPHIFLYSPFLFSGVAGLRGSFNLSTGTGEEVRWSTLAGVLALLGRPLGVNGLPRADGGFGEAAGLGEAVLPLGVAGDDGRCLDKGLGLEERKIQKDILNIRLLENDVNTSYLMHLHQV